MTPTIEEVYFLVRVGTWTPEQLQAHIDQLVTQAVDHTIMECSLAANNAFQQGDNQGYNTGYDDGRESGYNEGYAAGESRGYQDGLRDGDQGHNDYHR
jgi:flagellar biosynthesis/type III secretory pathway protein FliH